MPEFAEALSAESQQRMEVDGEEFRRAVRSVKVRPDFSDFDQRVRDYRLGISPESTAEHLATELLASLNEANRVQREQSANLERFCRLLEDSAE